MILALLERAGFQVTIAVRGETMPIDEDGPPRADTPCFLPAVGGSEEGGLTAEVIRENQDWVRGLSATGDIHERASRRLYAFLLRTAVAELGASDRGYGSQALRWTTSLIKPQQTRCSPSPARWRPSVARAGSPRGR